MLPGVFLYDSVHRRATGHPPRVELKAQQQVLKGWRSGDSQRIFGVLRGRAGLLLLLPMKGLECQRSSMKA